MSALLKIFPRYKHEKGDTILSQAKHLKSEAEEVIKAIYEEQLVEDILEEAIDAIHSAVTLIRDIQELEGITDKQIGWIIQKVIDKNQDRGYYG